MLKGTQTISTKINTQTAYDLLIPDYVIRPVPTLCSYASIALAIVQIFVDNTTIPGFFSLGIGLLTGVTHSISAWFQSKKNRRTHHQLFDEATLPYRTSEDKVALGVLALNLIAGTIGFTFQGLGNTKVASIISALSQFFSDRTLGVVDINIAGIAEHLENLRGHVREAIQVDAAPIPDPELIRRLEQIEASDPESDCSQNTMACFKRFGFA